MKNRKLLALLCLCAALLTMAFAAVAEEKKENPYFRPEYDYDFVWSTKGISKLKSKAATAKGTVETLTYETPAYAVNAVMGTDYVIEKSVNIYLPAGYDPAQPYNILYLMHGGGDDQDYWLIEKSDRTHGKTTTRVLDHMIEDGLCDPLIVVTPTFYSPVEGVELDETKVAEVCEQIGEPNYTKIDDLYTWFFGDEFRKNVIPAVESKYLTHANKDVSEENLIASRDHRAYCGLSMGSLTSFHAILMRSMDLIAYRKSLGALVDTYRESAPEAKLFLMISPTAYPNETTGKVINGINAETLDNEIPGIVTAIAGEKGAQVIDVHSFTAGHADWFVDGVHPNGEGHQHIAEYIYENIKDAL